MLFSSSGAAAMIHNFIGLNIFAEQGGKIKILSK